MVGGPDTSQRRLLHYVESPNPLPLTWPDILLRLLLHLPTGSDRIRKISDDMKVLKSKLAEKQGKRPADDKKEKKD